MARNKKDKLDAAEINKQNYIRENYIAKDDNPEKPGPNNRTMIVIGMVCTLIIVVGFVTYWTFFMNPQEEEEFPVVVEVEATPTATVTPEVTINSYLHQFTPATPRPVLDKFKEYESMYPDIVGWISIDNIKVDYPVVQSPDPANPFKYLTLGPDEKETKYGAIFLDIRNSIDATDRNTIIYGHNMRDGAMFGQLDKYLTRSFFFNHLIIRYDTLYQELEWEVFNVFLTTTDFYYIQTYFKSDEDFTNLMTQCVYKSYYNDNTTVITPEDRVLTLSTCTNDYQDGRLVVQARLITPLEGQEENLEEDTDDAAGIGGPSVINEEDTDS